MRKKALIAISLILALRAGAQENKDLIIADASARTATTIDGIRIEGFVPDFLKISLDFAPDNSAFLAGYYPSEAAANSATATAVAADHTATGSPAADSAAADSGADKRFPIRPGMIVDLGMAILVSNVMGSYTISVRSANGGQLVSTAPKRSAAPESDFCLSYSLGLGDRLSRAESGVFNFSGSGKSRSGGTRLKVFLVFDELKPPIPHSVYTDELSFVVKAN